MKVWFGLKTSIPVLSACTNHNYQSSHFLGQGFLPDIQEINDVMVVIGHAYIQTHCITVMTLNS